MHAERLKAGTRDRLWAVTDRHDWVRSATLTGSFLDSPGLDGISDIDFVVVVDRLTAERFARLQADCDAALRGFLADHGYEFRLNPTLGPLKFNAPRLAVLHLMIYTEPGHVEHVLKSPFTCLDWQRSATHRKHSLAELYPVFGLQPRHFLSGRRGAKDYLRDLLAGEVSYRELECTADGHTEVKRGQPMTPRDRHEFAYHVMRFLMQNLLKLLTRTNEVLPLDRLTADYFAAFPDGAEAFAPLLHDLASRKKALHFDPPVPDLLPRLEQFVTAFEAQFRGVFERRATRHLLFRHAPTPLNDGRGSATVFQGRGLDPEPHPIPPETLRPLADAVAALNPTAAFTSPLRRAKASLEALFAFLREGEAPAEPNLRLGGCLALPKIMPRIDGRLAEIAYGALEGLTVAQARAEFPALFAAWSHGEDPRPPGGENYADVSARLTSFLNDLPDGNTVSATHNVVLRCLIGRGLGVPPRDWHRLRVPHLAPITVIRTVDHGLFVELPEEVERQVFAAWAEPKPALIAGAAA